MSPELREQYLHAMGIQVWQSRQQAAPVISETISQPISQPETSIEEVVAEQSRSIPLIAEAKEQPESSSIWSELEVAVSSCVACELHQSRTQAVIAEGTNSASLMFVATAPASNAESASSLLAAESSQLFTNMLKAIEIDRADIYFTSLVKCQLPNERQLRTTEVLCCEQYLSQQIEMVKPDLIVALGEFSAQQLVVSKKSLHELRGKVYQYHSIPLIVMPHPDELLIKPEDKRQAWHDLLQIKQKLNG